MVQSLEEDYGIKVKVDGLRLSFLNRLELNGLLVLDHQQDTLVYGNRFEIKVSSFSLSDSKLAIDGVMLDEAVVKLQKYEQDSLLNLDILINKFERVADTSEQTFDVNLKQLSLTGSKLLYHDHHLPEEEKYDFTDLDLVVSNVNLTEELAITINKLAFKEAKGLEVEKMELKASYVDKLLDLDKLNLKTTRSEVFVNGEFEFDLESEVPLLEQLKVDASIEIFDVYMSEFKRYLPKLPIYERVQANGEIKGSVKEAVSPEFKLQVGSKSLFNGAFEIKNVLDTEKLQAYLSISDLVLAPQDYRSWYKTFVSDTIPEQLLELGSIYFNGEFDGSLKDFDTDGTFVTDVGTIETHLSLTYKDKFTNARYAGDLALYEFDLSKLVSEDFGKMSFSLAVEGSGLDKNNFDASLKGAIEALTYKEYEYHEILIDAEVSPESFAGQVNLDDPNIKLNLVGEVNLKEERPVLDFLAEVDQANLYALNLYKEDSIAILGFNIDADFKGSKLDDLDGQIVIENTQYETTENYYYFSDLTIKSEEVDRNRVLEITSDMAWAKVEGEYNFEGLWQSINYTLSQYFSKYKGAPYRTTQAFTFEAEIVNIKPITDILLPELYVESGSNLKGFYNSANGSLALNVDVPEAGYKEIVVRDLKLDTEKENLQLVSELRVSELWYSEVSKVDSLQLTNRLKKDTALFNLNWSLNQFVTNQSAINGYLTIDADQTVVVGLFDSQTSMNEQGWNIEGGANLTYLDKRLTIDGLVMTNRDQRLALDGVISDKKGDKLEVDIDDVNLVQFNQLMAGTATELAGNASVSGHIQSVLGDQIVEVLVEIDSLGLNQVYMGDLSMVTDWVPVEGKIGIDGSLIKGTLEALTIKGVYYPLTKNKDLDVDLKIGSFNMQSLEAYLSSIASPLYGKAYGDLKISGSLKAPTIVGDLNFQKANFKLPLLNAQYNIDGQASIHFEQDYFEFVRFKLVDNLYASTADVSGRIYHKYFKDLRLDLQIDADSLLALNTDETDSDLYYGKAFATGIVKVNGPTDDINLTIVAKANKGTKFSIPLSGYNEIGDKDYITFVDKSVNNLVQEEIYNANIDGINLNFQFELTPDALVEIIFDQTVGDVMQGRGTGNLQLEITSAGDFNMYGDYLISDGEYFFTLEGLVGKRFKILPGGTISWNGDPYAAKLDLTAQYKLKTSLYPLQLASETSETNREVQLNLMAGGVLSNPDITFDINVPYASEEVKAELNSRFRNQNDLNTQVISLLVLNSFVADGAGSGVWTGAAGATTTEMLSNQLSNWLSASSDKFDVGINYVTADEEQLRSREVEVALSTQFFNDRVTVNGNLGVPLEEQTEKTTNLIGDVNVEVNITEDGRIRARAFNRSNEYDPLQDQTNSTQGIGIFYQEEFDTWAEYFRKLFNVSTEPDPKPAPESEEEQQ